MLPGPQPSPRVDGRQTAGAEVPGAGIARPGGPWIASLILGAAIVASEWIPGVARSWGWAPRADFGARFALLRSSDPSDSPAFAVRTALVLAILFTWRGLHGRPARRAAYRLALELAALRALLSWWLPWRTGPAALGSADWLTEPQPLGAPAPLGWFAWIWLIALWTPKERGGVWGSGVALLTGAWAFWACGLADLGGCLIVAVLAAPLWLGYRAPAE